MTKRNLFHSVVFSAVLMILLSCATGSKEYNDCQERCEYNRRYCFEACGGANSAGFTFDMRKGGWTKPYSCQERCDRIAENCKSGCEPAK